jgi:hypothetical protein
MARGLGSRNRIWSRKRRYCATTSGIVLWALACPETKRAGVSSWVKMACWSLHGIFGLIPPRAKLLYWTLTSWLNP